MEDDPPGSMEDEKKEALKKLVYGAIALGLALAYWVFRDGARVGTGAFFVLGLALLWAGSSFITWWRLRNFKQVALSSELALAEAHLRQVARVQRHERLLALRRPYFTYALIACISAPSAAQLLASGDSIEAAGLVKNLVRDGEWWRMLTGTYLHGGPLHFWMNMSALRAFGAVIEAYSPRTRLPLVYLASALAGSLASFLLLPNASSVGASGGLLGLVGYLMLSAWKRPNEVPPWLKRGALLTLGLTAYLGAFGAGFIDNAAHAGGALMGVLLALLAVDRESHTQGPLKRAVLEAMGWASVVVLLVGAVLSVLLVLGFFRP
ncbi:MAG: rhomboid family intramembrane serine protease [Polyangiaceae bacterium]|nr:rhomboid family intramembrane serine protease [Polyangiaceae bacterium]